MDIEPLPLFSFIPSFVTPDFGTGQIIALAIALLCLFLSGFVSGSEMAFFSLTQSQCACSQPF